MVNITTVSFAWPTSVYFSDAKFINDFRVFVIWILSHRLVQWCYWKIWSLFELWQSSSFERGWEQIRDGSVHLWHERLTVVIQCWLVICRNMFELHHVKLILFWTSPMVKLFAFLAFDIIHILGNFDNFLFDVFFWTFWKFSDEVFEVYQGILCRFSGFWHTNEQMNFKK